MKLLKKEYLDEMSTPNKKPKIEDPLTQYLKEQVLGKDQNFDESLLVTPLLKTAESDRSSTNVTPEKNPIQVLYYVLPNYQVWNVDKSITSRMIIQSIEQQAKLVYN